jgi:hypothetical protein
VLGVLLQRQDELEGDRTSTYDASDNLGVQTSTQSVEVPGLLTMMSRIVSSGRCSFSSPIPTSATRDWMT